MASVTLHHRTERYTHSVKPGRTLLEVIQELEIPGFSAPCGGRGTCGKCIIQVQSGTLSPPAEQELRLLDSSDIADNYRLACCTTVTDNATPVEIILPEVTGSIIQTSGRAVTRDYTPRFIIRTIPFTRGTLENQASDIERILSILQDHGIPVEDTAVHQKILQKLSRIPQATLELQVLVEGGIIRDIRPEPTAFYGVAVDIGTTTVVIQLIDLATGAIAGTWSALNEQKRFGADVISRIQYSMEDYCHTAELQRTIVHQIHTGIVTLMQENDIEQEQVHSITVAGNTTMLHMLIGCETGGIAAAPFIPVFTGKLAVSGYDLGLTAIPLVTVELLPSIAAYVGADITAGMSITGLPETDSPALLLDIGTNGEMALGSQGEIVCCSTAAGPAFEGANIRYGIGGVSGAIDSVQLKDGKLSYTTIGGAPAVGLCGSAIIDAAAILIESGAADYTGRMVEPGKPGYPWIREFEGQPAMLIASKNDSDRKKPIFFTQNDLREVQLAKAAIAGGILTLLAHKGLSIADITRVYLAGGFGSYINPVSAGIIGLLPGNLSEKAEAVGNTACEGAIQALLDRYEFDKLAALQLHCTYLELSSRSDFQNFYIQEMYFGEF